ncbi:hypothetical protein H0H93_016188 [Arthromyces matolae]|nr:hypothetical protein H0H93_016188 [Arthromyces matolae]
MPINVPVLPGLVVKDIRQIDFVALKAAGYRGAVFDKDNCITLPHRDTIVPDIQEAWDECRKTFGEGNVLIVSNSAGTSLDPGGIQPAYSCIAAIRTYFSSLRYPIRDEELIIVGDRIFTDIVMANRMRDLADTPKLLRAALVSRHEHHDPVVEEKLTSQISWRGPLPVWTTHVWKKDSTLMRWCEQKLVDVVRHWSGVSNDASDSDRFVKEIPLRDTKSAERHPLTTLISKFKAATGK